MSSLFFDGFACFGPKPMLHGDQPWTLDHLIDEMRHCSISGALVTSTRCRLYDPMLENRRLCEQLASYDHLFALWNVMPHWTEEFPEPEQLTNLLREYDVPAVTVYPKTNNWRIRLAASRPLFEELQRTRTLVVIDGRDEVGPEDVEFLLTTYPDLPLLWRGIVWSHQRFVLPLLFAHKSLHIGLDHFQINNGLEWLCARGCEDQLVFTSNAADMSMGAHRCYIDYADLADSVKAKIASGNLIRLLKGKQPPREAINPDEDELITDARAGKPLSCLVLDMHAHCIDEGLNGAGGAYTMFNGGASGMLDLSRRMGVDGIGIMSWQGANLCDADAGNDCVRANLDMMPQTCWGLGTFDVIHDSADQIRTKLQRTYADKRFVGLKPYHHFGKDYDDPVYDVWWEFAQERGLYALLHPARPDMTEFDALCPKYPNAIFICAHSGTNYQIADLLIERARKYANLYLEITLTPVCMGIIDYLARRAGADRVLYGTDQPMRDPRQQFGWVIYSRLSVEDKKRILGLNAQGILNRVRTARM